MVINLDKYIDETEAVALTAGYAVAAISKSPSVILPITAVTLPTVGNLPASSIETQDHPDGSTTGAKFEFQVPDDYNSGDLLLSLTYAMSTAVAAPNNQVVLEVGAEIAKASDGTVDTVSYPLALRTLVVPDNLTDVARSATQLTIAEGDFAAGDRLVFFVKRVGAHASDLHTGDLQIIEYLVTYDGQVAARRHIESFDIIYDTDEATAVASTLSGFDTLDFETAVDQEQRVQFTVPDQWDGVSDLSFQFVYAMTTAAASVVYFETEGEIANAGSGSIDTIAVEPFALSTSADTDVHRTVAFRVIQSSSLSAGSVVSLKFARRGTNPSDTHGGDFKLIGVTAAIGAGPSTAVANLTEFYLTAQYVRLAAGTATSAAVAPSFGGDFEQYTLLSASAPSSQINIESAGRLASNQASIFNVKIPVYGNAGADYAIKIYVEGFAATPVYDSGVTAAPLSRTLLTINETELTGQPSGEKRFFVVVEAHLDTGEELYVGNPFVRLR